MPLEVKVWGDYACFTRPEMKVERVSYPLMTPSAARGALEAIFWKPECAWRIREIRVLKPIRYASFVRNEIKNRQSERAAQNWARTGVGGYDAPEDRAQRHTLALQNVAYVIVADVVLRDQPTADAAKYRDQFRRRVLRGQCFARPYLGIREFTAFFGATTGDESPIDVSEDMGRMLFDFHFPESPQGMARPHFFDAVLSHGVLRIPSSLYDRGR